SCFTAQMLVHLKDGSSMIKSHLYQRIVLTLLSFLYLASVSSFAQSTSNSCIQVTYRCVRSNDSRGKTFPLENQHSVDAMAVDLFTSLPNSDAVVAIDVTRVMGEAFPQLLATEPPLRNLVSEIAELK